MNLREDMAQGTHHSLSFCQRLTDKQISSKTDETQMFYFQILLNSLTRRKLKHGLAL